MKTDPSREEMTEPSERQKKEKPVLSENRERADAARARKEKKRARKNAGREDEAKPLENAGQADGTAQESPDASEREGARDTSEEQSVEAKARTKRKRRALIFLLALLVAAAVALPLTLLNYSDVRGAVIGKKAKNVVYCSADFDSDVWEDEDYQKTNRTVSVYDDGDRREYAFTSLEEAERAFEDLALMPNGGKTLGRYFSILLNGTKDGGREDFAALFSAGSPLSGTGRFPPQKLCRIELVYKGEDKEQGLAKWEAYIGILKNDGLAVDYLQFRDNGKANIFLETKSGDYKIVRIDTVYGMN